MDRTRAGYYVGKALLLVAILLMLAALGATCSTLVMVVATG